MTGRVITVNLEAQGIARAADLGRCAAIMEADRRPRFANGRVTRAKPFRRRCPNAATRAGEGGARCDRHAPRGTRR